MEAGKEALCYGLKYNAEHCRDEGLQKGQQRVSASRPIKPQWHDCHST